MNREERSAELWRACEGDVNPKRLAEKILESDDKYSVIEQWLAINYLGAIHILDGQKMIKQVSAKLGIDHALNFSASMKKE
jgi:hypothetical protein